MRSHISSVPSARFAPGSPRSFGILSSFPPTPCGIATFSAALAAGLIATGGTVDVVRCGEPPDLEDALAEEPGSHRFVADASGAGTTLYTAPHEAFVPEFGFRSAALHREGGARPIAGDLPRLRRDVDDAADLADAISIGVGAHTAVVVAGLPAEIT